jgi:hypothetical protein
VLRAGFKMEGTSTQNIFPITCNRLEATWKKALRVSTMDHVAIMEEAGRRNRLECVCVSWSLVKGIVCCKAHSPNF